MPQKEAVSTDKAPPPMPFFSQAIKCQGMVYCSGSIGMDPATMKLIEGSVGDRTAQSLKNLSAVLEAAGSSIDNCVKVNVFLTDMENFAAMNKIYDQVFDKEPKPVRTCVAVHQLPLGTDVEIECTAHHSEYDDDSLTGDSLPPSNNTPFFLDGHQTQPDSDLHSATQLLVQTQNRDFGDSWLLYDDPGDQAALNQTENDRHNAENKRRGIFDAETKANERRHPRAPSSVRMRKDEEHRLDREDRRRAAFDAHTATIIERADQGRLPNETDTQMAQRRALQVLESIRPSPTGQPATNANSLADNIGLLLNVRPTQNPPIARQQKRPRGISGALDESDNTGPTATSQRPTKRLKLSSNGHTKGPADFTKFTPLRYDFLPHSLPDPDNDWFERMFIELFVQTVKFADTYFGIHDLAQGESHRPWAINMTPEFLRYVEKVAEPDPANGGWDNLLQDNTQRKWLIVAVLVRIMEVKIFAEDLWGANNEEKQFLHGLDRALLPSEGMSFARTSLRAQAVRTIIGQAPTTEKFWPEVVNLTAQVSLLLKPLTDYLHALPPTDGVIIPALENQYQALHNVFAKAGYLAISIRRSPTIIYLCNVMPGTPYDMDDQHDLEYKLFAASKESVRATFLQEHARHQIALTAAENLVRQNAADKTSNTRAGLAAEKKLHALQCIPPLEPPGQRYRAMTKIAVWPNVCRYSAGNGKAGGELDGMTIYNICKSAVISYYGKQNKTPGERLRLADFVKEKKTKLGPGRGVLRMVGESVAFIAMTALVIGGTSAVYPEGVTAGLGEGLVEMVTGLACKIL